VKLAYVDTSYLVSIAFREAGSTALSRRLDAFDDLVSSNLLEAELLATFARERLEPDRNILAKISWIIPDRPLHAEIAQVLAGGLIRGGDCWHLAAALYLAHEPSTISFLTLDIRQRKVARGLGFAE
jgi:predicted nucleic acid-binding protein